MHTVTASHKTIFKACILACAMVLLFAVSVFAVDHSTVESDDTVGDNTVVNSIIQSTTTSTTTMVGTRIQTLQGPGGDTGGAGDTGGTGGTGDSGDSGDSGGDSGSGDESGGGLPGSKTSMLFYQSYAYNGAPSYLAMGAALTLNSMDVMSGSEQPSAKYGSQQYGSGNLYGVWAMTNMSLLYNTGSDTRYGGSLMSFMGGMDAKITPQFLLGMGLGYEHLGIDTDYNDGSITSNGFTLMPYASFAVMDTLIVGTSFGTTFSAYDTERDNGVDGDYSSTRTVWAVNLDKYFLYDQWTFNTHVGHIYSNEYHPEYNEDDGTQVGEADTYLGEVLVGGNVGYNFGGFSPYVGVDYIYDYTMNDPNADRDEIGVNVGATAEVTDDLDLSVDVNHGFDRDDRSNTSMSFTVRYEF